MLLPQLIILMMNARLPTVASMTANQSQIFSQAFDYYLGEGAKYIPDLYNLSKQNTKEADDKIMR
jgi:hypothetical protein